MQDCLNICHVKNQSSNPIQNKVKKMNSTTKKKSKNEKIKPTV